MAWTLAFEGNLEDDFLAASADQAIVIVRFGLLLAMVLYAAFGILDVAMLPETYRTVWAVRFGGVLPVLFATLAASFHPSFPRFFRPAVVLVSLVLGTGILLMIHLSQPQEPGHQDYYAGLLLVVLWIGTFSQLGIRGATLCIGTIVVGYGSVVFSSGELAGVGLSDPRGPVLVGNAFFLMGSAILAIFSAFSFERLKRRRFLQRREIAAQRERTQTILDRVERLFGQQVSTDVAHELSSADGDMSSRLFSVAVMFVDIRDFSAYADARHPEEVAELQNLVLSEIIDAIRECRGLINQILGDGVMASFGAPNPSDSHAEDAVVAARRLLKSVEALAQSGRIPPIRLGVGIHTGQVLAGNLGNEYRKQYSLTGSVVNLAARIEGLNKTFSSQLLVSGSVWDALPEEAREGSDLGEVEIRGFSSPTRIYRMA